MITIRVTRSLRDRIKQVAKREEKSLNKFCVCAILDACIASAPPKANYELSS